MAAVAIEVQGIRKQFGTGKRQIKAVDDLTLTVAAGQVYGFLGPNGAGKTTTIRIILDLIRPTQGAVRLFGQPVRQNNRLLRRVGALVEGATCYPYLTGRKNLEVLARSGGYFEPGRIQSLLELVGMADRADRPTRGYSTGMKQRLGVAAALLGDPDLVILDEPTNGLDPAGMQDMRALIRRLVDEQGRTVFLSSHMLNEVEQICDRVAIINRGRVIREGDVKALLTEKTRLRIEAEPLPAAMACLQPHWTARADGDAAFYLDAGREQAPQIVQRLAASGIQVYQVTLQRQTLEEFFLQATQEGA
ncbi:MAG: ABC transporter ATP-binding protein [Anaerolineae bacterium]|nr:ABC transporter ATP-binding protein [Anaerolineae bacterium]